MQNLFLFMILFSTSCATLPGQVSQGIQGQTVWITGNRMPGPETVLPEPEPVQRWVLVTPVVTMADMPALTNGLYPSLPEQVIDSVKTDKKGNFSIALPPGTYSVFTREENGYFANRFDEKNQVQPVRITDDHVQTLKIEINYTAVY